MKLLANLSSAAALALAGSCALAAPAGTVAFTQGDVNIRTVQGALRSAATGVSVESGETVETGRGRAQLRMVDGAYISLQPETTLRLDQYQTASPGVTESGLMSLLRGGLRTVTGVIGRTNRQNYRLTTPTATVGIRGTEFLAAVDNGTRVRVAGGEVAVCNDGGCLNVASGQTGFAPTQNARPVIVSGAPSLPPEPPPQQTVFVAGEERNARGESLALGGSQEAIVPVPLPSGAGGVGFLAATTGSGFNGGIVGGTVTYGSGGELIRFIDCCSGPALDNGVVAEYGADGVIAWGRWSGGTFNGSAVTSMHYYAVSSAQPATIPVVRAYASFASTAPTLVSASGTVLATGVTNSVTGTLNVNFTGSSGGTVSYALQVPIAGQTFSVSGSANQYGGTSFLGTSSSITSTGGGCSSSCVGTVPYGDAIQGSIAGTGNTRAGASYSFSTSLGGNVGGAIVFK